MVRCIGGEIDGLCELFAGTVMIDWVFWLVDGFV
jgi:hypothetical protein